MHYIVTMSTDASLGNSRSPSTLVMPRRQSGSNPQHLLVTLMGDFWNVNPQPVSSRALVDLLHEFGVSSSSARSTLSRLASRGVLSVTREGRHTFYRFSDETQSVGVSSQSRILAFGQPEADGTSDHQRGSWVIVTFSIPDDQRQIRSTLRARLRWSGFTPLQDGVWVAEGHLSSELLSALNEIGEQYVSAFEGTLAFPTSLQSRSLASSSHLEELRTQYDDFIATFEPLMLRAEAGDLTPQQALVTRVTAMDQWRGFYRNDPQLPDTLLPTSWPRRRAAQIFISLYDTLGPLAELRCWQIIERAGAQPEARPRHFTSATVPRPLDSLNQERTTVKGTA
jgi:phenylacetic acid degradation operon negative regulatory protein